IYYLAKGAFTAQRLEEEWKKKEWVPGVPKLSTLEQHFKSKGGYEIVGEVKGADMVGWQYEGPFDELPAQQERGGDPKDGDEVMRRGGPASRSRSSEDRRDQPVSETELGWRRGETQAGKVSTSSWLPEPGRDAHRVIAWDAVGETEGTGIVHI